MLVPTLIFPIILGFSGYHDWEWFCSCYLGTIFLFLLLIRGAFSACATDNQVVAAILGFSILLSSMLIVILGQLSQNYLVSQMVSYLSVPFTMSFVRGMVRSYNLVYFASFVTVFYLLIAQDLKPQRINE